MYAQRPPNNISYSHSPDLPPNYGGIAFKRHKGSFDHPSTAQFPSRRPSQAERAHAPKSDTVNDPQVSETERYFVDIPSADPQEECVSPSCDQGDTAAEQYSGTSQEEATLKGHEDQAPSERKGALGSLGSLFGFGEGGIGGEELLLLALILLLSDPSGSGKGGDLSLLLLILLFIK